MVKSLVLFYSRTGNTKLVAEEIAKQLNADLEALVDLKDRKGVLGYLGAGRDAMRKKSTEIKDPEKRFEDYDSVFIGTPVWGFTLAPAIRTYLQDKEFKGKKFGIFCTMNGGGSDKTFEGIRELIKNGVFLGQKAFIKPSKDEAVGEKVNEWIESLDLSQEANPDSEDLDEETSDKEYAEEEESDK